mgnify:FL=1
MLRLPAPIRAKLKDQPSIILFDSLMGDRSRELHLVKKLIVDEWRLREAHRYPNRIVSEDTIAVVTPSRQPQQPNGWDCALYALTNIQMMLCW